MADVRPPGTIDHPPPIPARCRAFFYPGRRQGQHERGIPTGQSRGSLGLVSPAWNTGLRRAASSERKGR